MHPIRDHAVTRFVFPCFSSMARHGLPMCFSAMASFSAAAVTGAAGIASLRRTKQLRDVPLACLPLLFATQQVIEGGIWLGLRANPGSSENLVLAAVFAGIALVLWPVIAPLAVGLAEREKGQRWLIYALVPLSLLLAVYSTFLLISHPYTPTIVNASICYSNATPYPVSALVVYLLCTCLPPLLSSDRFLQMAGIVIVIGLVVSAIFYYESFFSVWCFFAALASVAIFASFQNRNRSVGAIA